MTLRGWIAVWAVAGLGGGVMFWLVQIVTGGPTITAFLGEQIVAAGGYPQIFSPLIGWAVHLAVSLSYAFLFAVLVSLLGAVSFPVRAVASLVGALGLGWVTAAIAPPAISVTIGLLGQRSWPAELFPLNTELGLPLWNHLLFFLLNWAIQLVGPGLFRAGVKHPA